MSAVPPHRRRRAKKPYKRGPPLRTQAGKYAPILTFFDAFLSFTRDVTRTPERDFRLLQAHQNWEAGSSIYRLMRHKFLTSVAAETRSPVHHFFVKHKSFVEYDCTASPHREFARLERLNVSPVNRAAFHAAFWAEFNSPLDSSFVRYRDFKYNPRGPPMGEFLRLVAAKGWDAERARHRDHRHEPESRRYHAARSDFLNSVRLEFDYRFGRGAEDFGTWRKLCDTLGVLPMPGSVAECKEATRPIMVNIYDLTHHKRTGAPFDFFKNLADLRSYTNDGELYFPLSRAKASALKFLLRQILPGCM